MQFLLQLYQPRGGQMDILQHDPTSCLDSRVDSLVSLAEALSRSCKQSCLVRFLTDDGGGGVISEYQMYITNGYISQLPAELCCQVHNTSWRIETCDRAHEYWSVALYLVLYNGGQVKLSLHIMKELCTDWCCHIDVTHTDETVRSQCLKIDQQYNIIEVSKWWVMLISQQYRTSSVSNTAIVIWCQQLGICSYGNSNVCNWLCTCMRSNLCRASPTEVSLAVTSQRGGTLISGASEFSHCWTSAVDSLETRSLNAGKDESWDTAPNWVGVRYGGDGWLLSMPVFWNQD